MRGAETADADAGGWESTPMRVLVTGHRGYIGAVVANVLKHSRFDVVGLDCDLYGSCDFGRVNDDVPSFDIDLREIEFADLLSFDAVVHLAALPEDDEGQLDPHLIEEVNYHATVRLAECCLQAQVPRFLFASTCAVYGRDGDEALTEESPVNPITAYAKSKLACEKKLAELVPAGLCPVCLRNGTVYGVSPRMRLDTVVNDFVGSAVARKRVDMRTEGRAWRPLVHVEDVARAYAAVLTAPDETVSGHTFNVVGCDENYRIIDVCDAVVEHVGGTSQSKQSDVFDKRSYRVDGSKLAATFAKLSMRWTLEKGIRQLRNAFSSSGLSPGLWRSDRFRRMLRLQSHMERGLLDSTLRHAAPPVFSDTPGMRPVAGFVCDSRE